MDKFKDKRLWHLDLARFLAMLFMVQGHSIYAFVRWDVFNLESTNWLVWHLLRGYTAPVFLTVSGIVHFYANKRDKFDEFPPETFKKRIKTGLLLIFIGYLLEFPADRIWELPFLEEKYIIRFAKVNILHLIGFVLILTSFLFKLVKGKKLLTLFSFALFLTFWLLTPTFSNIRFAEFLPYHIANYFNFDNGSFFPLFPFASHFFLGLSFGAFISFFQEEKRKKQIVIYSFIIGFICFFSPIFLNYSPEGFLKTIYNFSISSWDLAINRSGYAFLFIFLCFFIDQLLKRFRDYYYIFSRRAILVYVIHLVIIYGVQVIPGLKHIFSLNSFDLQGAIILAILVILLSFSIVYFVDWSIRKYENAQKYYYRFLYLYLILMLVF